jgi:hypothetical protein
LVYTQSKTLVGSDTQKGNILFRNLLEIEGDFKGLYTLLSKKDDKIHTTNLIVFHDSKTQYLSVYKICLKTGKVTLK